MSDTPRTDEAQTLPARYPGEKKDEWWVRDDFARQLECELTVLSKENERLSEARTQLMFTRNKALDDQHADWVNRLVAERDSLVIQLKTCRDQLKGHSDN